MQAREQGEFTSLFPECDSDGKGEEFGLVLQSSWGGSQPKMPPLFTTLGRWASNKNTIAMMMQFLLMQDD